MNSLTSNQQQILLIYSLIILVTLFLGLLNKHKGLGLLVGLNLGVTIVGFLWLWKGQQKWNEKVSPSPSPRPA